MAGKTEAPVPDLSETKCPFFYDNGRDSAPISTDAIKQVYKVINAAARQSIGASAITALDSKSFVDLGKQITDSDILTDAFYKALTLMAADTIISFRPYESTEDDLIELSREQYGLWVRKIRFKMPDAHGDDSVVLTNGTSVDMYEINMPEVVQKNYGKIGTYEYHVTFPRYWLQLAFESESKMSQFLAGVSGWINNRMALDRQNVGMLARNNFIANIANTKREVKLVTLYNAATGSSVTAANAEYDPNFIRFAIARMQTDAADMTKMRADFNDGTVATFTPKAYQRFYLESSFVNSMSTVALYNAFNRDYLSVDRYREVSYWQNPQTRRSISVKTDGGDVTIDGIVGMLFDRDAIGSYRHAEESYTTPINARGRYVNVFWFVDYQPINDLSENGIVYTLR